LEWIALEYRARHPHSFSKKLSAQNVASRWEESCKSLFLILLFFTLATRLPSSVIAAHFVLSNDMLRMPVPTMNLLELVVCLELI
jgi:hypothetical protein